MQVDLTGPQERKDRREVDNDQVLQVMKGMTPGEAGAWIDANVTDLASAKHVMKRLAMLAIYLLRNME